MNTLLIAGTDRGVGKTVLTTILMAYWRRYRANQAIDLFQVMPPPLSLGQTWQQLETLRQQTHYVLFDSWAGLGEPLDWQSTWADLAGDWRLPTVLVVPVQPNTISQAVAHVALARDRRVRLTGIVLNCVQPDAEPMIEHSASIDPLLIDQLQSLSQTLVLGVVPYLDRLSDEARLAEIGSALNLEKLLGDGDRQFANTLV